MEQQILNQVEKLKDEMVESIRRLVRIDSVEGEAEPDAPFGRGVRTALDTALELAGQMGFRTADLDHYIGYAEYGEGEDYVCAIGHLDVVPPGDGWKQPPFSGWLENGVIYSRGVLDNKGPVLACLYGLYALKQLGWQPKHRVRVIFGCDEETGFEDLKYYLSKEQPPVYGFTPDCKYPVVYGERGRAVVRISAGGSTEDALAALFAMVTEYFIGAKNTGDRLGIDYSHPEYGVMEMRGYKLALENGIPYFEVSFRYPAGCRFEEVLEKIRSHGNGLSVRLVSNYEPVAFEKDSPMVQALQECYEQVTGLDGTPVTTTGGTYAKAMPGIVPFGPSFPGQKGIGHNPNEWMTVEDLVQNARIYALALYRLGGL